MTTLETKPTSEGRVTSRPAAGRTRPGHPHVIWAVFKRNFMSYFSNPPAICSSRCLFWSARAWPSGRPASSPTTRPISTS